MQQVFVGVTFSCFSGAVCSNRACLDSAHYLNAQRKKSLLCLLISAARGERASLLLLRAQTQEIMLHLTVFFISVVIITGSEHTGSGWPFCSNHPAHTQLPVLCRIKSTFFSRPSTLPLLPATSSGNLLCSSLSFGWMFLTQGVIVIQKYFMWVNCWTQQSWRVFLQT